MPTMKKILATCLLLAMLLSTTACGGSGGSEPQARDRDREFQETSVNSADGDEEERPDSNPTGVAAVEASPDDFRYSEDNGGIVLERYTGDNMNIIIPSDIDGMPIVALGNKCFTNKSVESVVLSDTVENIGDEAFTGCKELHTITLGNGVKTLGEKAFMSCSSLTSITLPEGLESVGSLCFAATNITSFNFPASLDGMGLGAFGNSDISGTLTVPASFPEVPERCFANNKGLEIVIIEDGITVLPYAMFEGCSSLREAHLPSSVVEIDGAFDGVADGFTIVAPAGSYAESYAQEEGFRFQSA